MFRAAFTSRSNTSPQDGQTWGRTESLFWMRAPQPLQSCDVYAGGTASTRLPAHAALQARMTRKACQPAFWMDVLRPAFAWAPVAQVPTFAARLLCRPAI